VLDAVDSPRVRLVLYRKRRARRFRLASTSGVRFRYSRQKEAARGCGGRGVLWEFNRFLPETPCQTWTLAKTILLIFHHVASASSYLRPHPFFKRTVPTLGSIHAAASDARAASFWRATRKLSPGTNFQRGGPEVGLGEIDTISRKPVSGPRHVCFRFGEHSKEVFHGPRHFLRHRR
jgi:hypothetical protein